MTEAIALNETADTTLLVFTDSAAAKVSELIREEGNPNLKLRVFVSGGGCSGFQYGFTFDENEEDGVPASGRRAPSSTMSFQYLTGAESTIARTSRSAVRDTQSNTDHLRCGSSFSA
jgi:iron-sulfur cluster insertion protein